MSDLKEQELKECISVIDNIIEHNNKELKKHIEEKIEQIIYERNNHRTVKYYQHPYIIEYNLINNVREGLEKVFTKEGYNKQETFWSNNKKHGIEKIYRNQTSSKTRGVTNTLEIENYYIEGNLIQSKLYDFTGNVLTEIINYDIENKEKTSKRYYSNGQLEYLTRYQEEAGTKNILCYSKEGVLQSEHIFTKGHKQTIYYYEDGVTIKSKEIYDEEREVINYDRDGSFIDHYIYDKKGKLISKKHGKIHDLKKPTFEDLNFDKALKLLFSCESITEDSISIKTQVDKDSNKIKLKITHGKNELVTELSSPEQLVNIGKALERVDLYKKYSKK